MTIRGRNVRLFAWFTRPIAVLLSIGLLGVLAGARQEVTGAGAWSLYRAIGAPPEGAATGRQPAPGPLSEVGALAGRQYAADSLAVPPTAQGARLRSAFQKIHDDVTRGGLWITSTASGEEGRLRMMASAIGRDTATVLPVGRAHLRHRSSRSVIPGLEGWDMSWPVLVHGKCITSVPACVDEPILTPFPPSEDTASSLSHDEDPYAPGVWKDFVSGDAMNKAVWS